MWWVLRWFSGTTFPHVSFLQIFDPVDLRLKIYAQHLGCAVEKIVLFLKICDRYLGTPPRGHIHGKVANERNDKYPKRPWLISIKPSKNTHEPSSALVSHGFAWPHFHGLKCHVPCSVDAYGETIRKRALESATWPVVFWLLPWIVSRRRMQMGCWEVTKKY